MGVLVTAAAPAALHPRLTRSGLLDVDVEIPPPRPASRAAMLKALMCDLGAVPLFNQDGDGSGSNVLESVSLLLIGQGSISIG